MHVHKGLNLYLFTDVNEQKFQDNLDFQKDIKYERN